jgi:hypothetical protein
VATKGRLVEIEQYNEFTHPPGRAVVRTASGSVAILDDALEPVDRGLAEVEIFNDDTWQAAVRLEGDGPRWMIRPRPLLWLKADGNDVAVLARVRDVYTSWADDIGAADSITVEGVGDAPPPL